MLLSRLQKATVQPAALILLIGLFLVLLPHFNHLPFWLSLITTLLIVWRACYELQLCPIPGKKVLFLLTIMLLLGIIFSYHTLIGRDAGSAMLLGLLCLKLFEIKSFRDISIIINLALFSIVINFLFSQSIPVALIMLLALVFLFTSLISFQHNYNQHIDKKFNKPEIISLDKIRSNEKHHFKLAVKMLSQAVPFAIIMFILFPRVNGPLWGLPEDAFSGTTGLTDTMSPGRISQLSDNNEVAFRVEFHSPIPPPEKLYWRGPVMWNFDGYDWTAPEKERIELAEFQFTSLGKKTDYSITLQPHNKFWMFALDLPAKLPVASILSVDMQVLSALPIQKLQRFKVSSFTDYILPQYKNLSFKRYLKLPDSGLSRSRLLIEKLKDSANPQNTVNNVLNYFSTQNFYYSRQPPLLYDDPVDEFLFDTKRGYCEHYASSFTVLMRLANIPARVVTGYQGGELNPINNFMTIRQSDAHAWSEIYLADKGWLRIDPTAAIPPGNIENVADAIRLNSSATKPSRLFKTNWLAKQMKQIRFAWDAVNNRWNQWILGYNNKKQKAFFEAIGIPEITWKGLSQLLFGLLVVLTGILALVVFSNKNSKRDQIQKYYFRFLKKLRKQNLIKNSTEGAEDFAKRAILKLPHQNQSIMEITNLYQQLRYKETSLKNVQLLQQYIKNFHAH